MTEEHVRISKFLSFVLRHGPGEIGLRLDGEGWAEVDELIALAGAAGRVLSRQQIEEVVTQNDKRRFALSGDGQRIRAVQGHSISVDLGLVAQAPPEWLYHGTATRFLAEIREAGLRRGHRHHVHLSPDEPTATRVGQRHGRPVVLRVRAGAMWRAGIPFYRAENGVWLTESVPVEYLELPAGSTIKTSE